MFRLAAQRVERGEIEGKAETAVWIARRMNVIVGEEWDKALQACADYFDANAADDAGSIIKVLNEIADRIYPPTPGLVHIVQDDERETETVAATNPDDTPGETANGDKPEDAVTEQGAAEPPKGNGGITQNCPGGNCPRYPAQNSWFWW